MEILKILRGENGCPWDRVQTPKSIKINLNIPLYVEKEIEDNLPTLEEAKAQLKVAMQEAWEAEERFKQLLTEFTK